MTISSDGIRKSGTPGSRAVGFRAPSRRQPQTESLPPIAPTTNPAATTKTSAPSPATTPRNAPPLKKRAKGSGFLSVMFLIGFGSVAYLVWTNFLQFQSYGVISGRLISVSAPWDGTILSWQVRDGDLVQQGDVVATMSNLAMQHELAALGDELKMSQANLDAEMAKIQFDVKNHSQQGQKATAEYLQAAGELLSENAKYNDLDRQLKRADRLYQNKNISKSEYEKLYFQYVGQKQKIEKLQSAVEVLKTRSELIASNQGNGSSQLKPLLAQIKQTQSEMTRLRERIDQGQVTAPVSGRITQRFCLTGESAKERDTVLEILEDNSIEVVLYVPQNLTNEFEIGSDVEIQLEPSKQPLRCSVKRLGERFEPAPNSIERYYQSNQYLLPIYLTPHGEFDQMMAMRIQGMVKRPYEWTKSLKKGWENIRSQFETHRSLTPPDSIDTPIDPVSQLGFEPAQ